MFQMIGFAPGDTTFSAVYGPACAGSGSRTRRSRRAVDDTRRRRVMRVVFVERVDGGFLDVLGRIEVGLADLHVHDAPAFASISRARAST